MRSATGAIAIVLSFLAVAARAETAQPRRQIKLVIGFVAFNSVETSNRDPKKEFVTDFLRRASDRAAREGIALRFDMVQGNYYQVLHWLRAGAIDGAVLSPFTYDLLLGDVQPDDPAAPIPTATFPTAGLHGARDGGQPMFRVVTNGVAAPDAEAALRRCVEPKTDCTFAFVSHLSTTGFIFPLMQLYPYGTPGALPFDELLRRTRFTLWHSAAETRAPQHRTVVQYTYSGDLLNRGDRDTWTPIDVGMTAFPNDTLVLMRKGRASAYARAVADVLTEAAEDEQRAAQRAKQSARKSGYQGVEPAHPADFIEFHEAVRRLSERTELQPYWRAWYTDEKYDFSVAEVVDLLHNDQYVNGRDRAAIVLPGGGVRGAYQARVLDELYDRHVLNDGWADAPGLEPRLNNRLKIASVVGTSGGALMGYLAARRSPCDPQTLTSRWDDLRPTDVFPRLSVLRFASILVALVIFGALAAIFTPKMRRAKGAHFLLTVGFAATLLIAPALMWRLSHLDFRYASRLAGIAYLALLLILHFVQTTLKKPATARPPRLGRTIFAIGVGGVGLLIATIITYAILFARIDPQLRDTRGAEPLLAVSSILLAAASMILMARAAGAEFDGAMTRDYAHGVAAALLFLLFTTGLVLMLTSIDYATVLELTRDYWKTVLIAALGAAAVTLVLSRWSPTLRIGTRFWVRPHSAGPFLYTPILTLLLGGFIGVGAWILLVAPALYDGETGHASFARQAATVGRERTRFVAPITALEGSAELDAGDYYAYQSGAIANPRFLRFTEDRFLQAVSASGSPFPIYPGRSIPYRDAPTVFTDGGFAHLVPVEGAVLLGAKQVLIVGNSARHDERVAARGGHIISILLTGIGTMFNYLFDRAQLADLDVERDVLVASIAPDWQRDDWKKSDPFLMDFQPQTILDLIRTARDDTTRGRPARVLSWGEPSLLETETTAAPAAVTAAAPQTYLCSEPARLR